jgi:hypothetical protein
MKWQEKNNERQRAQREKSLVEIFLSPDQKTLATSVCLSIQFSPICSNSSLNIQIHTDPIIFPKYKGYFSTSLSLKAWNFAKKDRD